MTYNFEVLDQTGLKLKTELEALFGVSRVSLHNYKKGKTQPSKYTASRTKVVLDVLTALVAAGKLPFKENVANDVERRASALQKLTAYVETRLSAS